MKKNDILITDETDSTILPLILKAKAIVTDTGGLLCHAAIISRELKIPCIVGTKTATQVLKDGDLIEVNANKGVVKIIEKSK
ncbi:Phosphoenolpyruvate synthase [subsurface metagenome]